MFISVKKEKEGIPSNADAVAVVAVAQDITVALDTSGSAFISPSAVDGGSTAGAALSISRSFFDCSDIGDNRVILIASLDGEVAADTATVTVVDEVAPTITQRRVPIIWDADDRRRKVGISRYIDVVSDNCNRLRRSRAKIAWVSSDEPVSVNRDIIIANNCRSVKLRANRDNDRNANGRVYTIGIELADSSGNIGSTELLVYVPRRSDEEAVKDEEVVRVEGCDLSNARVSDDLYIANADSEKAITPNTTAIEEAAIAYPNPFSEALNVRFKAPEDDVVQVALFHLSGKMAARVFAGKVSAGSRYEWTYETDKTISSGIFILKVSGERTHIIKKVVYQALR